MTHEQYNQLLQHLIKNSQKKQSGQNNNPHSGRTRTKTTSSGAIVGALTQSSQITESKKKQVQKLSSGSSQFVGIINGGTSNNTF